MNKTKQFIRCVISSIILLSIFFVPVTAYAATEKTAPIIKIKVSTQEPTNQPITVTFQATDKSGLSKMKYALGSKSASYFSTKGKVLKLNSKGTIKVKIKENGVYSFYAKDKAGNTKIKKITITNIDRMAPTGIITQDQTVPINTDIILKVVVTDSESGIQKVQFLAGDMTVEDFLKATTATDVKLKKNKGSVSITENGTYSFAISDKAGNITIQTISISNIDKTVPTISTEYSVMNQTATVTLMSADEASGVNRILYLKGTITDVNSEKWETTAKEVLDLSSFTVNKAGNYSIMVDDKAGNKTITNINVILEMRGMWITFLEFAKSKQYTQSQFQSYVNTLFDNCVDLKMNAVIVQVRPFGDAMYNSSYFPWSAYASGTQGVYPGYDPLQYMISAAHERGLEFHAYINPYRITGSGTDVSKLSTDNQARKWRESSDATKKRNVLTYDNKQLYYNPSSSDVQRLIVNGVKEIVSNYDVDGIHFDDYFYPSLNKNYKKNFDAPEYVAYVSNCVEEGTTPDSIVTWRRNNVSSMIRKVYSAIKDIKPQVQFGISPAGNISNLKSSSGNYVDIEKWLSSSNYVDYICPQIYWTFQNKICPYAETVNNWLSIRKSSTVKMYVGIATYRAGSSVEPEWEENDDVLKRQIEYGRSTGKVDGHMFFRYESFFKDVTQNEVSNLISILK